MLPVLEAGSSNFCVVGLAVVLLTFCMLQRPHPITETNTRPSPSHPLCATTRLLSASKRNSEATTRLCAMCVHYHDTSSLQAHASKPKVRSIATSLNLTKPDEGFTMQILLFWKVMGSGKVTTLTLLDLSVHFDTIYNGIVSKRLLTWHIAHWCAEE